MIDSLLSWLGSLIDPSSPAVYLIAFAGGLLASFLPCSLSSLPLVISYVGAGEKNMGKAFRYSLLFALGMSLTYTVLASLALALGSLIGTASRLWYLVLAVLMLLMGLQMLGVFTFIPSGNRFCSLIRNTCCKRASFSATVAPSRVMIPSSGNFRLVIRFKRVDFPAPFRPRRPYIFPASRFRLT